jgi:hypothetical protein
MTFTPMQILFTLLLCFFFCTSNAQNLIGVKSGAGFNKDFNVYNLGLYWRSTSTFSIRPELEVMNFIDRTSNIRRRNSIETYVALPFVLSYRPQKNFSAYATINILNKDVNTYGLGVDYRLNQFVFATEFHTYRIFQTKNDLNKYVYSPVLKANVAYIFNDNDGRLQRKPERERKKTERLEKSIFKAQQEFSRVKNDEDKVYKSIGTGGHMSILLLSYYLMFAHARANFNYSVQTATSEGRYREWRGGIGYGEMSEMEGGGRGGFFIDASYLFAHHMTEKYTRTYFGVSPGMTFGKAYGASPGNYPIPYVQGEVGLGLGHFALRNGVKFDITASLGTLGLGGGAKLGYTWSDKKVKK